MGSNEEIIQEAVDEIEIALQKAEGVLSHQRRLAFLISAGGVALLESFLQKRQVLKPGAKLNHQWFKKNKENVKKIIARQLSSPIESVTEIDKFLDQLYSLEKERNQLAYGKKSTEEKMKTLIGKFLDFKKEAENV